MTNRMAEDRSDAVLIAAPGTRIICGTVKPSAFRYHTPATVDETLAMLAEFGDDASLLAGGQSLVPMMNLRLVQAGHVIDLNGVRELESTHRENGTVCIGALTRQRTLERMPDLARTSPLLAQALPEVAYPSIRARGTVGGSIAHADPSAELSTVMVGSDASFVLAREDGRRTVRAQDFFLGPYYTVREPGELLVEVRVPLPRPGEVAAFQEFSRKPGDFAMVLVAVVLELHAGCCTGARIAVGGAGPAPVRAAAAEAVLAGGDVADSALLADVAAATADELEVSGDVHGSAAYRRRLVRVLVRRTLEAALARPRGEDPHV
jgi:carbon-monoxide dehydrogenase medium subunit